MNPGSSLCDEDFAGNIQRFSGFAELYDRYRPGPPEALAGLLARLAGSERPNLVVDLGSGTGLSTRYWADRAGSVIGIEPAADMRRRAQAMTSKPNVAYCEGFSHRTGLPDGCADIVTCSQALHWMEPASTFEEVRRILRPGGVFTAYDYDWPPVTGCWEADAAWQASQARSQELERQIQANPASSAEPGRLKRWAKEEHLDRMRASGCFSHMREILLHHLEPGNAERFVGLGLSQGSVMSLLKRGYTEQQLGIDRLREVAARTLGIEIRPWHWSSRCRVGVTRGPSDLG